MQPTSLNVLVVGATGGSGRAVVASLLAAGHRVTAYARSVHRRPPAPAHPALTLVAGDALRPEELERAMPGHDAVVVTLGISESPLGVRLRGSRDTALHVRSEGTRNVIAAMRRHGVRRLVVLSSFGVGATRDRLRLVDRVLFRVLLRPQIDDTEVQESIVKESGLEWVLAQPVHLTDDAEDAPPFVSVEGAVRHHRVARGQVAAFLAEATDSPRYVGRSVALSG